MRWRIALVAGVVAWLYAEILVRLFAQWMTDRYSSHGLLIPIFASLVLWQVATKGDERHLVLYWFQAHGQQTTNEFVVKYLLIKDSIRLHRSDGGLIRFMTLMQNGESPDSAQERTMRVAAHLLAALNQSIPR